MNMRSLVFACCLVGIAHAQSAEETRILMALQNLRTNTTAYLQLTGTETTGSTTVDYNTTAYLTDNADDTAPSIMLELRQERDGVLKHRLVGDGKTLWAYNNAALTYGGNDYGRWGTVPANAQAQYAVDYRQGFMDNLNMAAVDETAYLARLIRQIYGGDQASYASWMPGVTPTSPDGISVRYQLGNKLIDFELSPNNSTYDLTQVVYDDTRTIGSATRHIHWVIDVKDSTEYTPDAMTFKPELAANVANWKQLVRRHASIQ